MSAWWRPRRGGDGSAAGFGRSGLRPSRSFSFAAAASPPGVCRNLDAIHRGNERIRSNRAPRQPTSPRSNEIAVDPAGNDPHDTSRVAGAAEADVAGRAVGRRARCARRHPVAAAVRVVAEVRAAAHDPVACQTRGPCGIVRSIALRGSRVEPVGAPLPDVAGHVVEAVAVGRERVDRSGAVEAVRGGVLARERRPARRSSVLAAGLELVAPRERPAAPGRRARRTPTPPRSAGACRPTRSRRGRRSRRRARPGARRALRVDDCGPSGWRQSAPSTCRHQGAWATALGGREVVRQEPGEDERPAVVLGLGHVAGGLDERARSWRWRPRNDRSRTGSSGDPPNRALAISRVGPPVVATHEEGTACHRNHALRGAGLGRGDNRDRRASEPAMLTVGSAAGRRLIGSHRRPIKSPSRWQASPGMGDRWPRGWTSRGSDGVKESER